MKIVHFDVNPMFIRDIYDGNPIIEDAVEIPEPGQIIRTKKAQIEGCVEKLDDDEVYFRVSDGRLMKTSLNNVIIIEKLADEEEDMMEDQIVSEINSKYETEIVESKFEFDKKSGKMQQNMEDPDQRHSLYINGKLIKTLSSKDEAENLKKRDPRFKSAEIKKTNEGTMGGISQCAPSNDASYQNILSDVYDKWKGDTVKVSETGPYYHKFDELLAEMEEDNINEVSKSTLGSYIKKASKDVSDRSNEVGFKAGVKNSKYNTSDDTHKETMRHRGINRAVDKLSK